METILVRAMPVILTLILIVCAPDRLLGQTQVVVVTDSVTIFEAPSFDTPARVRVPRGTIFSVLQQTGDWLRVLHESREGFVHVAYTSFLARSAPTMLPEQQTAEHGRSAPPPTGGSLNLNTGEDRPAADVTSHPDYKNPGTATLWSVLVPGGGQFYSGEAGKGFALLGLSVGSLVGGAVLASPGCDFGDDPFEFDCSTNVAPFYVGVAAALGIHIYSIIDADDAAHRANERLSRRIGFLDHRLRPVLGLIHGRQLALGFEISI